MTTWRYQPVYETHQGDRSYSLVEVQLDGEGRLKGWTDPGCTPVGNDPSDLMGELINMMRDANRWVPVDNAALVDGMTFQHRDEA